MKKVFLSVATILSSAVFVNAQNSSPYWSLAGNSNATSSSKLGTTNAINLRLYTNNLERARITTSGLVGIGTISPTERLHVNSPLGANAFRAQVNGYTKLLVHSGGGVSIGANATPPANGLYISGNVGIGTKTPSSKLHVIGNATITNGLNVTAKGITSYNYTDPETGTGIGVYAVGDVYGLHGIGGNRYQGVGVRGDGDYIGVYGSSDNYNEDNTYGIYGQNSRDGAGAGGRSEDGYGGEFISNNFTGLYAATNYGSYAAEFSGDVSIFGKVYYASDKNLKKNVREIENAMNIINKLKPKNYDFRNDVKYASLNLPKGNQYGLIAQELEEVLPGLVKESSHELRAVKPASKTGTEGGSSPVIVQQQAKESINIKAVNYVELIPIIVKGMQELNETKDKKINDLQKQIDEQQQQINELKSLVQTIAKQGGSITSNSRAFIKQNIPNPSNNNTLISYFTPAGTRNARIIVTDMKGSVLKTFTVAKGEGQVNIRSGELAAGTYNYTLYVNNSLIDTKQMIIIK